MSKLFQATLILAACLIAATSVATAIPLCGFCQRFIDDYRSICSSGFFNKDAADQIIGKAYAECQLLPDVAEKNECMDEVDAMERLFGWIFEPIGELEVCQNMGFCTQSLANTSREEICKSCINNLSKAKQFWPLVSDKMNSTNWCLGEDILTADINGCQSYARKQFDIYTYLGNHTAQETCEKFKDC